MTDSQFQPGQPIPPTQGGGVFGGNPEEVVHDPSMFGPLQQNTPVAEDTSLSSSPFDGYVIPQDTPEIVEPIMETPAIEPTVETVSLEPVVSETEPVVSEEPLKTETVLPEEIHVEELPAEEVAPIIAPESIASPAEETVEEVVEEPVGKELSDVQQKFTTLFDNVSELTSLLRLKDGEVLEIVGANNDKLSLLYQFGINDQHDILVKRIETDKEDDDTTFNELKFSINPESDFLDVFLDEVLLFEESDLLQDNKKKSQVMDKLNKFIFLTESKLKDIQKELRAKQEEEEERRRLQDIFRNF